MYEAIKLTDNSYYIESPAKVGIITSGNEAVLIDSGNDKSAGKKLLKLLNEKGLELQAILNTHSHADHIGGNRYLQAHTNCNIFASGIEADFINHPILEPSFLYGGNPPSALRHKFLMAEESFAKPLEETNLPFGIEPISLKGHSFDMVGFKTSDNVIYLGDCLSSRETIQKYKIGFIWDVAAYIKTLENVMQLEAEYFVPSHAAVTSDIRPLAEFNINSVFEIAEQIKSLCKDALTFEELLQRLFYAYSLNMTFEQYALVGSTVKSYLTWLYELGEITAETDGNRLLWRKI